MSPVFEKMNTENHQQFVGGAYAMCGGTEVFSTARESALKKIVDECVESGKQEASLDAVSNFLIGARSRNDIMGKFREIEGMIGGELPEPIKALRDGIDSALRFTDSRFIKDSQPKVKYEAAKAMLKERRMWFSAVGEIIASVVGYGSEVSGVREGKKGNDISVESTVENSSVPIDTVSLPDVLETKNSENGIPLAEDIPGEILPKQQEIIPAPAQIVPEDPSFLALTREAYRVKDELKENLKEIAREEVQNIAKVSGHLLEAIPEEDVMEYIEDMAKTNPKEVVALWNMTRDFIELPKRIQALEEEMNAYKDRAVLMDENQIIQREDDIRLVESPGRNGGEALIWGLGIEWLYNNAVRVSDEVGQDSVWFSSPSYTRTAQNNLNHFGVKLHHPAVQKEIGDVKNELSLSKTVLDSIRIVENKKTELEPAYKLNRSILCESVKACRQIREKSIESTKKSLHDKINPVDGFEDTDEAKKALERIVIPDKTTSGGYVLADNVDIDKFKGTLGQKIHSIVEKTVANAMTKIPLGSAPLDRFIQEIRTMTKEERNGNINKDRVRAIALSVVESAGRNLPEDSGQNMKRIILDVMRRQIAS